MQHLQWMPLVVVLVAGCLPACRTAPADPIAADTPARETKAFIIEDATVVASRPVSLSPDVVQIVWPPETATTQKIHVRLEVNTYEVQYRLAGANTPSTIRLDCFELHSLDDAVSWHWAEWWPEGLTVRSIALITGPSAESYLAWTGGPPLFAWPEFVPLGRGKEVATALREGLDATVNRVRTPGVEYIPMRVIARDVRGDYEATLSYIMTFRSIERLEDGGWRVTYSGVDATTVHTVEFDGKEWHRVD